MVGKGWVSAAFVLFAASAPYGGAVPLPDPTIPAPSDVEATYDEATDMVSMLWSTPGGLDEDAVRYIVYVNGDVATIADDPHALIPAPDGASLLQVSTLTGSAQSTMSPPVFFSREGLGIITLFETDDFPPQTCLIRVATLEPSAWPPAYSLDENCITGTIDDILDPDEAP